MVNQDEIDQAVIKSLRKLGYLPTGQSTVLDLEQPDYTLSCPIWPGAGKVAEECGELGTEIGKLITNGGKDQYWDSEESMSVRLENELADVWAITQFFVKFAELDEDRILARAAEKFDKFCHWREKGE